MKPSSVLFSVLCSVSSKIYSKYLFYFQLLYFAFFRPNSLKDIWIWPNRNLNAKFHRFPFYLCTNSFAKSIDCGKLLHLILYSFDFKYKFIMVFFSYSNIFITPSVTKSKSTIHSILRHNEVLLYFIVLVSNMQKLLNTFQ